mmetsp:Transcript_63583/g.143532  ORF Transcript_63583/g.143532 Transcript_63583/m.143532 type:complete len:264 (-) Transcript_63583:109-900(-)
MEALESAFSRLDRNGDGTVSKAEFTKLLQVLRVPDDMIADVFSCVDVDKSGMLSYSEFLRWLGFSTTADPNPGQAAPEAAKNHAAQGPAAPAVLAALAPPLAGPPAAAAAAPRATPRTGPLPLALQLVLEGAESKLVARDVRGALLDVECAFSDHAEVRSNRRAVELRSKIAAEAEVKDCEYRRGMAKTSPFLDVGKDWTQARQRIMVLPQRDRQLIEDAEGDTWHCMSWEQRWAATGAKLPGLRKDRECRGSPLRSPRTPKS